MNHRTESFSVTGENERNDSEGHLHTSKDKLDLTHNMITDIIRGCKRRVRWGRNTSINAVK